MWYETDLNFISEYHKRKVPSKFGNNNITSQSTKCCKTLSGLQPGKYTLTNQHLASFNVNVIDAQPTFHEFNSGVYR